ncbi:Positive regulator of CheA protein activity (CheW) [hydrothermal vent metagenome]|uniref:Positive regulator of CheA protein activity (CheW) n=1 Tax=hydrothermal vent metagenome TaxID=652676 RepID=A0A3B0V8M8_9ZZZZ
MSTSEIDSGEVLQLVTFRLGNEEFSVDILKVQEIIRLMELTRVPKAPEFIEGVINLRGKVIPVMDLRKRFGMPKAEDTSEARIIVVELASTTVGFRVDGVSEVLRLPADTVEPPPIMVSGVETEYIRGVGKLDDRLIILLDVEKVLTEKDHAALGNGAAAMA